MCVLFLGLIFCFGFDIIVGPNVIVGPRSAGAMTPPPGHVQWYYPPTPTPASPYHHHHHHQAAVPYYGYAPATYVATTDVSYNHVSGSISSMTIAVTHLHLYIPMISHNYFLLKWNLTYFKRNFIEW